MKYLKRDAFRLAGTYLAIIMVMSLGFSVIFYHASVRELSHRPRGFDARRVAPPPGVAATGVATFEEYLTKRAEESKQALLVDLALVNLAALIVGGLLSYLLAERTLRPIEANMEAQTQFVSDASHELRTPLTALRTANEVALRSKNLKLTEAKRVIKENVDDIARLQELANSMLGLLRDDDTALFQHTVSLQQIVSESMNLVVHQAMAKNIAVEDEVKNLQVRGNQQSLVQLLTILLDNAVKYSPKNSTIYLTGAQHGKQAIVTVCDEGMGMDAKTLAHIFTRFYRAEKSRTTAGYGLGLPIAQKIVAAHGGKLHVESEPSKGTAVTITLPIAS